MIIIEGIIGAGKTTLSNELHQKIPRSKIFHEPVGENPYLERFYGNPKRWALEMQYFLMAHRYKMHVKAVEEEWSTGVTTIFDRSIYGDRAFADVLYGFDHIDELGYGSYMQHRECMERQLLIPQQVIYLEVSVDTALNRIQSRGRECERGITRDYLERLSEAYEKIICDLEKKTNVQRCDWKDGASIEDIQIEGLLEYEEIPC